MIAAIGLYCLAVATFLGFAAWALEQVAIRFGMARRFVWLIALLASSIVPALMIAQAADQPVMAPSAHIISMPLNAEPRSDIADAPARTQLPLPVWPDQPHLNTWMIGLWILSSAATLALWTLASIRTRRVIKGSEQTLVTGRVVFVTETHGPAVFGYFRPRILVPRSLLDQPRELLAIVIQHEQQHVDARDPLLLLVATALIVLAPWNIALWWQLRRLRFAIETDCDARVLRAGTEPIAYGEVLLTMGQRSSSFSTGAVALTEPVSQLEKRIRIMIKGKPRRQAWVLGLLCSLAATFVVTAASLNAPATESLAQIRKPINSPLPQYIRDFETMLKQHHPKLLTEKVSGMPVFVVLYDRAGKIERWAQAETFTGNPKEFKAPDSIFERFGVKQEELGWIAVQGMESAANNILVIFSYRKEPASTQPPAGLFSDTSAIDRALVARFFPDAMQKGVAAGEGLWVLFDPEGNVLRTGREPFEPNTLEQLLESRYRGIDISAITVSPVTRDDAQQVKSAAGEDLQLHSLWLDPASPLPSA
jgi:beta-lactamase regulating signal transducer with metallopeptidase domain